VLAATASVAAHDMWIDPTTFAPDAGKVLGVRLRIGQDLVGDPLPRDPGLIDRFVAVDATGRRDVPGRDGGDPAGLVRVAAQGLLVLGYQSHPSEVSLVAGKFNQYLKEEGLEQIAALRATRQQTGADVREAFARCAKSLVQSGPVSAADRDRALGFTLELVAERNPYSMAAGDELPVVLTYQQRPLAGALVVAINRRNPEAKVAARSDVAGRVRLRLPESGMWLVKAVHMVPPPAGADVDWASYWASLTFQLGQVEAGSRRMEAGRQMEAGSLDPARR
jgi:uncharacterized GH25 family protein